MPHQRQRFATNNILKKLTYFRVVGIQGPRQCGKSFLARELIKLECPRLVYKTLDQPSLLDFSVANPEMFLSEYADASPLVIDEAQKNPRIFDAIKYVVDQDARPGQFLLLGSTEFSKKTLIRETLTGRIGMTRLHPMTCAEAHQRALGRDYPLTPRPSVTRSEWLKYLSQGGMPGICFVREAAEREDLIKAWIDTTVFRDLALIPKMKLNPDLAKAILQGIATLEEPTAYELSRALRRDPRVINTHLNALMMLFVLNKVEPHSLGTGKTRYFLCDVAFTRHLGASLERQIETAVLQELLARREYLLNGEGNISYYRTTRGSIIHFVVEGKQGVTDAIKIISAEKSDKRDFLALQAFGDKCSASKVRLVALTPLKEKMGNGPVTLLPWESVC